MQLMLCVGGQQSAVRGRRCEVLLLLLLLLRLLLRQ